MVYLRSSTSHNDSRSLALVHKILLPNHSVHLAFLVINCGHLLVISITSSIVSKRQLCLQVEINVSMFSLTEQALPMNNNTQTKK